jgi:hypothetical protein
VIFHKQLSVAADQLAVGRVGVITGFSGIAWGELLEIQPRSGGMKLARRASAG